MLYDYGVEIWNTSGGYYWGQLARTDHALSFYLILGFGTFMHVKAASRPIAGQAQRIRRRLPIQAS